MWPWGHLAAGYLVYSVVVHLGFRRRPDRWGTVALAFGTQFPDIVDKPLAWSFGLIPNGRSLAHSLLTAVLVIVTLNLLFRRYDARSVATAFGIGYLVHLFTDAIYPLMAGEYDRIGFLAWPLVPPVEYATEPSFSAHLQGLSLTSFVAVESGLALLVFLLWIGDGRPGLGVLVAVPRWVRGRLGA
ncbi:metal-dependent hydrolase [Halorussus litoreus]|uniref:metal-dependent hydrolase n=1 Tax=Halorussus litoreus TaxID=1710536 RepID=UPI000E238961|nr:metal-dependent hydrolase [Halorussus litoreus]